MNDDSNNISVLIFQEITITSFGTTVSVSHILFIFCKGKGIFCCKFTVTDLCNIDFLCGHIQTVGKYCVKAVSIVMLFEFSSNQMLFESATMVPPYTCILCIFLHRDY